MALYEPTERHIKEAAERRARRVEAGGSPNLVFNDKRQREWYLAAARADEEESLQEAVDKLSGDQGAEKGDVP